MTTRSLSRDHRRVVLAERASERTQRRCLLVLAACDDGRVPDRPLIDRLDRLVGEADALWERLTGMPEAEARLRQAWRRAA